MTCSVVPSDQQKSSDPLSRRPRLIFLRPVTVTRNRRPGTGKPPLFPEQHPTSKRISAAYKNRCMYGVCTNQRTNGRDYGILADDAYQLKLRCPTGDAVGGMTLRSNPPFDPRGTESPALKAAKISRRGSCWRKRVGVEPTIRTAKDRIDGFEGREDHRTLFASSAILV